MQRSLLIESKNDNDEEEKQPQFKPIYKLNIPKAYTQDEWVTILLQSIQKLKAQDRIKANLGL